MGSINAQSSSIYGKVTDEESGEILIYANIVLNKNDVFATGGGTDFEGNYSIPVDPGKYSLHVSYTGYPTFIIKDVSIDKNQNIKLNISLSTPIASTANHSAEYKVKNNAQDKSANLNPVQIKNLPTKNQTAFSATKAGLSQEKESGVTIVSRRNQRTDYYIEGIRVSGKVISQNKTDSLNIMIPLDELMGGTSAAEN